MKAELVARAAKNACALFDKADIYLSEAEKQHIETADFGLGDFENTGLSIFTYVNTERVCAKEMALLPGQTCPEHLHPSVSGYVGKEETFRVRYGTVYLYASGCKGDGTDIKPPKGVYSVTEGMTLRKGDQFTIWPGTKHWFMAGPEGAVVSEFSTKSMDETDIFTDPAIVRVPVIE